VSRGAENTEVASKARPRPDATLRVRNDFGKPPMPDDAPPEKPRTGPALDHGPLPGLVGYTLRRAQLAVFQAFRQAMAPWDVTPGQYGVLVLIGENQGLSQSDLGAALGIDRSTMVAVIDRLEERGLVVRAPSPRDRRSYALELSAEGRRTLAEASRAVEEHEAAVTAGLSAAEKATLLELLKRVG